MAELTNEQIDWLKTALGFDVAGYAADGAEDGDQDHARAGAQAGDGAGGRAGGAKLAKGGRGKTKPGAVAATPVASVGDAPAAVADKGLQKALQALADEAAALKALGFDTAQMEADRADFGASGTKAEALPDDKARKKAVAALTKRVEQAVEHARALSKSTKKIMGDKTGNPDATQKSAIYKKALEDLYGLKIKVPSGMTNTHLDRVFDMFGSVPKDHVKQSKLKKLTYSTAEDDKGSGAFGSAEIEMGDFGDASGEEDYQIDGTVLPANSFDVTTLHEIGHSVDDKHKIMNAHQGKAGCGGWKKESVKSAAAAFVADLKSEATLSDKVTDAMLGAAVAAALGQGMTEQPDAIADDDWQEIVKYLVAKCLRVRSDASPWFKGTKIVVAGRVYQEAYGGDWWSFDPGAIASTKVNNYQWRSPAEWFAEVYAISWLKKKPPPSGVDASVAAYMWKG